MRSYRSPVLVRVGGVSAAAGLLAWSLALADAAPGVSAGAAALAGVALLGLTLAANAILRIEGLGGEGLTAAAGVLGAALVLLGEALALVAGGVAPGAVFADGPRVGLVAALAPVGWGLVALWVLRVGWGLSRLVASSAPLAWGSAGAAAGICAAVAVGFPPAHAAGAYARLAFIPVSLWSAGVAIAFALGHPVRAEIPE